MFNRSHSNGMAIEGYFTTLLCSLRTPGQHDACMCVSHRHLRQVAVTQVYLCNLPQG